MAALRSTCGHYIFILWFILLSFFLLLFSSPNLSGRRVDVYHTSTHGVALVRILNAGLKCDARGSLEAGNTGRKNDTKIPIFAPLHKLSARIAYAASAAASLPPTATHNVTP